MCLPKLVLEVPGLPWFSTAYMDNLISSGLQKQGDATPAIHSPAERLLASHNCSWVFKGATRDEGQACKL